MKKDRIIGFFSFFLQFLTSSPNYFSFYKEKLFLSLNCMDKIQLLETPLPRANTQFTYKASLHKVISAIFLSKFIYL